MCACASKRSIETIWYHLLRRQIWCIFLKCACAYIWHLNYILTNWSLDILHLCLKLNDIAFQPVWYPVCPIATEVNLNFASNFKHIKIWNSFKFHSIPASNDCHFSLQALKCILVQLNTHLVRNFFKLKLFKWSIQALCQFDLFNVKLLFVLHLNWYRESFYLWGA